MSTANDDEPPKLSFEDWLRTPVSYPKTKEHDEGYAARLAGQPESSCRYDPNEPGQRAKYQEWLGGFIMGGVDLYCAKQGGSGE